MGKKIKYIAPTVICPEPYTAEQQESRYKKDYEFNKPVSARSPVGGWENKYITEGNSSAPPKEISLVKGTPHKFRDVRTGNIYSSRKAVKRVK